jgi:hypothetical protein
MLRCARVHSPSSLSRRTLLHGAAALATVSTALAIPFAARAEDASRDVMARAATAFLDTLDARQRRAATFSFADAERLNWHYVPRGRKGVPLKEMPAPARAAAHDLLRSALSPDGYAKTVDVINLEEILRKLETFGGLLRDPERYYVSIFGVPDVHAPWGWRMEGHHLSLNFTLVPGRPIAMTPAFLGANPAEVRAGPHKGLRVLAAEQDLGVMLARTIDPALRARFVIGADSPGDIVTGPGRSDALKVPTGVALRELPGEQRALAVRLVETYARSMRSDLAAEELERMRAAGIERVHFAWAGSLDPARPHYYRLHGPTLLIEYDNSQNGANHVHTVWHDPRNDFGADVLRAHYDEGGHDMAFLTPQRSRHSPRRPGESR